MTIAFVINALETGGAERVFLREANELHARGHDVHMLLLLRRGALADSLQISGERVHTIGMSSVFDIRGFFSAFRAVHGIRPDVLYSTLNEANYIARLLALLMPHARLVTREANMADVKGLLYRAGDIVLGWRSQAIIAVSRAVGDSVLSYAPYLKSRIRVLYNPVDTPSHTAPHAHRDIVRLLTVGSLTSKKDQAILLRALPLLPLNVMLSLVGDGPDRSALQALAKDLSIEKRVTLVGAVPPSEVGRFYSQSDIFVLPSKREGCPNVVLEALSYGLPVVAFDIPGMAEFVHEEWGVLVGERDPKTLAEALMSLLDVPQKSVTAGEAGYNHVLTHHSIEAHMVQLVGIIAGPSSNGK